MAIILPLLLAITFGVIVWGWVFFVRSTMYHAAREAARAIAVQEKTTADAQAIAQGILDAALSKYTFTITIVNTAAPEISVTVSIPVDDVGLSNLVTLKETDMHATVVMLREGL